MTKREVIKTAQAEVRAGKDRKQVFEAYKSQVSRPLHLASAIVAVAREEPKKQNQALNLVLVVLLVVTGLLKAVGVFASFVGTNVALAAGLALLSVGIPFLFAFEVNRFNGQVYGILTILAGLGIVNVLLRIQEGVVGTLVVAALLGAILALSLLLRQRLFPGFKLLGVKTDGNGDYILG